MSQILLRKWFLKGTKYSSMFSGKIIFPIKKVLFTGEYFNVVLVQLLNVTMRPRSKEKQFAEQIVVTLLIIHRHRLPQRLVELLLVVLTSFGLRYMFNVQMVDNLLYAQKGKQIPSARHVQPILRFLPNHKIVN